VTRIFVSVNDYKPDELSWRILLYKAEFGIYLNFHAYLIIGLRKKIIIPLCASASTEQLRVKWT